MNWTVHWCFPNLDASTFYPDHIVSHVSIGLTTGNGKWKGSLVYIGNQSKFKLPHSPSLMSLLAYSWMFLWKPWFAPLLSSPGFWLILVALLRPILWHCLKPSNQELEKTCTWFWICHLHDCMDSKLNSPSLFNPCLRSCLYLKKSCHSFSLVNQRSDKLPVLITLLRPFDTLLCHISIGICSNF